MASREKNDGRIGVNNGPAMLDPRSQKTARVSSSFEDDDDDETIVYSSAVPSDFSRDDDESDSTSRSLTVSLEFDVGDDDTQVFSEDEVSNAAASPAPNNKSRVRPLSATGRAVAAEPQRIGAANEEADTLTIAVPQEILDDKPRLRPEIQSPRPLPLRQTHGHRPFLVDEITPVPTAGAASKRVRPLDSLPPTDFDVNERTMSSPNIVRTSFRPKGSKSAPSLDDTPSNEDAQGASAQGASAQGASAQGAASHTTVDDDTTGRLVIESHAECTVFVDGIERGKGSVVVDGLDRFTHYIVRVHRPQFRPWSASVSLAGKIEARVVPDLVPR